MTSRRSVLRAALALAAAAPSFALAGGHGRLGQFTGASGHVTRGGAEIAGNQITLLSDFQFDGAPDPKVALGSDGYDKSTLMGPLKSNTGKQVYTVPAGIDTANYNEVWIWCEKFNVPLGVAKIN
jgi:hypothetical protein